MRGARILPAVMALHLACPDAMAAEALVLLGVTPAGDEVLGDRTSLQAVAADELRPFPAVRVRAVHRVAAEKAQPPRTERYLFSVNCAARTTATLSYQNSRPGTRRQDWQGADIAERYATPRAGSIAESAMAFACSGGKAPALPVLPRPAPPAPAAPPPESAGEPDTATNGP